MTLNPAKTVVVLCAALVFPLAQMDARHHEGAPDRISALTAPTTLTTLPLDSEGLTVDPETETLYTAEAPDASGECIVRRTTMTGLVSIVGVLPKPGGVACAPRGLEFRAGHLYIADQGVGATGWVFDMNPLTGLATVFAAGVPGANGIAFDSRGNLWITDSLRGFGRVYRRHATTGAVEEVFRVPPVANGTTYGGRLSVPNALGIGRQIVYVPVGMQSEVKQVANGIAVVDRYSDEGSAHGNGRSMTTLYVADTARGAIWAARLDHDANLAPGQTGCDPTLQDNTLCEDALFVAHPRLEGADGMVADRNGNLWVTANSRQAIVRVDRFGGVRELFRNPFNSQLLRSSADTDEGNTHILEYPSNPVIVRGAGWPHTSTLCVTSTDRAPRDNWPGTVGEIGGPGQNRGKISCF